MIIVAKFKEVMMNNTSLVKLKVPKRKRIAIVAHDGQKAELFAWIAKNRHLLEGHELCGTGTTSTIIREKFELEIRSFYSGPLGGDQQIGAYVAEGKIDILVFFWDPLEAQPHDPDVKALLRIAVLYDVPVAMSPTSASIILNSVSMDKEYERYVPNSNTSIEKRVDELDFES